MHNGSDLYFYTSIYNTAPDTALCTAIHCKNIPEALRLIGDGVDVNARSGPYKCTALKLATAEGELGLMRALLKAGALVDIRNGTNLTPLFFAAQSGNFHAAQILIEHGADTSAKSDTGHTPLHFAISGPLANTSEDKKATVSLLLRSGVDIQACTKRGKSFLMEAVTCRDCGMVDLLLKVNGATKRFIDAVDIHGYTALHYAVQCGCIDAVKLLLWHVASIDIKDGDGRTAVQLTDYTVNVAGYPPQFATINRLLQDVKERIWDRTLHRVVAMGGHSRAIESPLCNLPPGMLTYILGRNTTQHAEKSEYDRFVDDVATRQLKYTIQQTRE
jgi:ankyrin repeat protein